MADEPRRSADLTSLGEEWARSAAEDLSGLLDIPVSISGPKIEEAARDKLLGSKGPLVCSSCSEDVFVTLPLRAALVLAAAQLRKTADEFPAFESSPFEGEVAQAYQSAMDICVGIFGRVLDEEAGLPSIQLGESSEIELPASQVPPEGVYRRAHFTFEIEGFPKESLDLLVPAERARSWFGEGAASEGIVDASGPIALIDPSAESREAFAELGSSLGRDVLTIDPVELDDGTLEELAETTCVVVTFDLGGRSGLDLIERLRNDESTANLRFAVACEKPTRAMVDAALRWGAHTVLLQPWESCEISERLLS